MVGHSLQDVAVATSHQSSSWPDSVTSSQSDYTSSATSSQSESDQVSASSSNPAPAPHNESSSSSHGGPSLFHAVVRMVSL